MTNPLAQDLGGVVLLPCPFCGKSCAVVSNTKEMSRPSSCFMYTVVCDATQDGCGTTAGYEFEEADAIAAWNTRNVIRVGNYGAAFDPPGASRAFTYQHQPGNVDASRLGRAADEASKSSAGDNIGRGLALLKALQEMGFGVYQISDSAMQQGGGGGEAAA